MPVKSIEHKRRLARESYYRHRDAVLARSKIRRDAIPEHIKKEINKKRYQKDIAFNKEMVKEYRRKNWQKYTNAQRAKKYNTTKDEIAQWINSCNNMCQICSSDLLKTYKNHHIDHCYISGKIRGVLCHKCNLGIGNLKDDVNIVRKALAYLERHQCQSTTTTSSS